MKIGYSKIGRSWKLDPRNGTSTGGDADVARTLHILSRTYPQHTFVLVGQNSGEVPQTVGYPDNVINPWVEHSVKMKAAFKAMGPKKGAMTRERKELVIAWHKEHTAPMVADMDLQIVWAGQHGTSNTFIPQVDDPTILTNPQDSFVLYSSFLIQGLNDWAERYPGAHDPIYLCPDPRNYLKARDIKYPPFNPIIAQFEQTRESKHEQYGDPVVGHELDGCRLEGGVLVAQAKYIYGALELTALPHPQLIPFTPVEHDRRVDFGMVVNENRAYVAKDRCAILEEWVMSEWPGAEVFGVWSDKAKETLGRQDISPVPYEHLGRTMQRWRCTLTTPASGSGWATAKPWEAFAYGTVCFFHPDYDTQGHILRDMDDDIAGFLRVKTPEELRTRVQIMKDFPDHWKMVIDYQRQYFEAKYAEHAGGTRAIQERLGL